VNSIFHVFDSAIESNRSGLAENATEANKSTVISTADA